MYSGYSSDELSENEYADPFEGEGPYSNTPPPPCDRPDHDLCVPPAWGRGSLALLCCADVCYVMRTPASKQFAAFNVLMPPDAAPKGLL